MQKVTSSDIFSTGLAIFSMFFGAGNLMYPIESGMKSGSQGMIGLTAFMVTAVLLPLIGLIGIILFDGDYNAYFDRLGKRAGQLIIFICMVIIGPLIAIPRIVTLSHTMISPFLPITYLQQASLGSAFIFSLLFLGITFLATYKESRIIQLLGYIVSPLLLFSLAIIIFKGMWTAGSAIPNAVAPLTLVKDNLIAGYETLDLLGAIFFSSIILHILKNNFTDAKNNPHFLAIVSAKAGLIGVSLLAIIYVGLGFIGAFYGHNLNAINPDVLFRVIALKVSGTYGTALVSTAVLMACFSTSIALAAVVGEYVQRILFNSKISYVAALTFTLACCMPLSVAGLGFVRQIAGGPIVYIGYPVLITITLCNIAYKLFGFKPIKIPALITFCGALISYYFI